jgi:hypothetical protein
MSSRISALLIGLSVPALSMRWSLALRLAILGFDRHGTQRLPLVLNVAPDSLRSLSIGSDPLGDVVAARFVFLPLLRVHLFF